MDQHIQNKSIYQLDSGSPTVALFIAMVLVWSTATLADPKAQPLNVNPVWIEQQKLTANDAERNKGFGSSIALSSDTVVIGTHGGNPGDISTGAYVFVRKAGVWTEQQKLTADDVGADLDDSFGFSVSVSGDTAVIGAASDDQTVQYSGAAYVLVRDNDLWALQQKLTITAPQYGDFFGRSVAVSGDTAVIGAPFDSDDSEDSGAAYVFVRNGSVWTEQQKLKASDPTPDFQFGTSVAISGDTVLIGTGRPYVRPNYLSGAAYVFVRNGNVWTEQQKLTASDASPNDGFGHPVSLSGDSALVGAAGERTGGPGGSTSPSGAAYVFMRNGNVWTEQQKLKASDAELSDSFGFSVSISGDKALIGRYGDGFKGYLFGRNGNVWTEEQQLTPSDGGQVYLSGDTAVIGAPGDDSAGYWSGAAYVFVSDPKPTTLTVVNTNDSGAGSLRQAIADAVAGDVITFDSTLAGSTITLTSGELVVDKNLSIDGDLNSDGVPDVTVSGNDTSSVFFVSDGGIASIEGLVITAGNADTAQGGGGILNIGTLTLTNSIVSNSSASVSAPSSGGGGIANFGGTLTVINSTVSNGTAACIGGGISNIRGIVTLMNSTVSSSNANCNGGGISNLGGTLTLTNSTVSNNRANNRAAGGGISNYVGGTLTLTNSTVSGNHAGSIGGGISNFSGTLTVSNSTVSGNIAGSEGGGICNGSYIFDGTSTLTNITVSGNRAGSAGGGIYNFIGLVTLTNSTFSNNIGDINGGGIFNTVDGLLGIVNTIIANSETDGVEGGDCENEGIFDIANSANNLIESGCDAVATLTDDPNLGPLQDNGGPTDTHALLPDSPVIDFIPLADCEVSEDQRGVSRPQGNGCDIGAFEREQGVGPPPPATLGSPKGTTSDNMPTFIWRAVSNSTWYYLWVQDSSGTPVHRQWYTAAQTDCDNVADHCSVTPETTLADGAHTWWIQTWNASGYGAWSSGMDFTVNSGPPLAATLVSPRLAISNNTPTFIWRAVSNSTWYYLWVQDSSGTPVHRQWYTAAQTNCGSGTGICSVTPETALLGGSYAWWIQTWNANAYGPWSHSLNFTVRSDRNAGSRPFH